MKQLKDYLHLYGIDCEIMTPDGKGSILVIYPRAVEVHLNVIGYMQEMKGLKGGGEMHYKYRFNQHQLQLCLRPLSDMTEEEKNEVEWAMGAGGLRYSPKSFVYLLSKHFDLFGLIEAGLAIDKTTLK